MKEKKEKYLENYFFLIIIKVVFINILSVTKAKKYCFFFGLFILFYLTINIYFNFTIKFWSNNIQLAKIPEHLKVLSINYIIVFENKVRA